MENKNIWTSKATDFEENKPTVYVVMKSTGTYEDKYEHPVAVYESKKDAEEYINSKYEWAENIKKNAIQRETEDGYLLQSDPFEELMNEYRDFKWKEMYGDKNMDEATEEEWCKFYDSFDSIPFNKTDGEFVKWLVTEKNIPEETAKCSVQYNDQKYDDSSDFNALYYIVQANIHRKKYIIQ